MSERSAYWKRFNSWFRINPANGKRSVFSTLLLSYLILLVLPAAIGSFLYHKIETAMIGNANQSNFSLLEQTQQVVDQKIDEVNHMAFRIGFNPKLQYLIDKTNVKNSSDIYKFTEFMSDVAHYQLDFDFISQFFIYMNKSDLIVSPVMKTDSNTFFQQILRFPDRDADQLLSDLTAYHWRYSSPSESVTSGSSSNRVIAYIQSLPINETTDIKGSLVVLINEKQIRDRINQIVQTNWGNVFILNERQEVILSTSDADTGAIPLTEMASERGSFPYLVNHENMYVSYIKSNQNGWTYVSVVPRKMILSKITQFKIGAIIILCIYLTAGFLFCRYLASKHYRPVRELVNSIVNGNPGAVERKTNEYDFIKHALSWLSSEKESLSHTLNKQSPVIRADFISRLMRGQADTGKLSHEDLKFMGVHIECTNLRVTIVAIDDCSRFVNDNNERERALIRFIISNLSLELWGDNIHSIDLDHDRVGLLLSGTRTAREEVERFTHQLIEYMELRFRTCLTIAISGLHAGLSEISTCYSEAVLAADYQLLDTRHTIVFYDEILRKSDHSYHYPLEAEANLMNLVKSGDEAGTLQLLNKIFETNFQGSGITPNMGKFLFFDLYGTLLKLRSGMSANLPSDDHSGEESLLHALTSKTGIDDMIRIINREFAEICHAIKSRKPDQGEQLYNRITQFVNIHYTDAMLSLNQLADEFRMNPSYLSAFFKKQSGTNLSDYIIELRIRLAKELLKDEYLTIQEIALRVGYANDVGFIRAFKKIEGIPPGKYRNTMQNS